MNRSLNITSQLRAVAYDADGRPSIPTLELALDFDDDEPTREEPPARRVTHEILVSRTW